MHSITALYLLLHLLFLQAPSDPKTADEVMQRVRQATQFSKEKIPDTGLQFAGKGTFAGLPAQYTLLFNRSGHFVQTTSSRITTGSGYDGTNAWIKDLGGEQRIQELTDRNNTIVNGLFATSLWLDPGSGMSYTLEDGQPKEGIYTLKFKHQPTDITGTIQIDAKTWLPVQSTMKAEGQKVTNKWSGILEFNGIKFPKTRQSLSAHDSVETTTIESIQAAPAFAVSPYSSLVSSPSDVVFDDKLPAELEVMRTQDGASPGQTQSQRQGCGLVHLRQRCRSDLPRYEAHQGTGTGTVRRTPCHRCRRNCQDPIQQTRFHLSGPRHLQRPYRDWSRSRLPQRTHGRQDRRCDRLWCLPSLHC
ncbi:MAG: hypothetical protein QM703_14365 [Gemmatales bacterium]